MTDSLVLAYHAVSPTWSAPISVDPRDLETQLAKVMRRGYRAVTASELVHARKGARMLAVTFDDAFRSVLTHGAPVLARLQIPGTVFAVTNFVGASRPMCWPGIDHWLGTRDEPELTSLGWEELKQLAAAGWEIGSHTRSHPWLTRLSQAELESELRDSRTCLEERLDRPCTSIAYPFGDHDERVERAATDAGYEAAFTVPSRLVSGYPMRWPRVGIYKQESTLSFRAKISPTARTLRRSRVWTYGAPVVRVAGRAVSARAARRSS